MPEFLSLLITNRFVDMLLCIDDNEPALLPARFFRLYLFHPRKIQNEVF